MYDENDDPIQHGVGGWQKDSTGIHIMRGICLGICLSVQHADDEENSLFQHIRGDSAQGSKGSYQEATVQLIYGHGPMWSTINNVVIAQNKTSATRPGEDEPFDFSEEVPNGCSAKALDSFNASSGREGYEDLDGDYVLVDFIGGQWDMPVIVKWFPHPKNLRDAARKSDGNRTLYRRNGTSVEVDKDGNLSVVHRKGSYVQIRDKNLLIKHIAGQSINLDDKGKMFAMVPGGASLLLSGDATTVQNGQSVISMKGADVRIRTPDGAVSVTSKKSYFYAEDIAFLSTPSLVPPAVPSAKALTNEVAIEMMELVAINLDKVTDILTALSGTLSSLNTPPLTPIGAAFTTAASSLVPVAVELEAIKALFLTEKAGAPATIASVTSKTTGTGAYRTKVMSSE